MNIPEDVPFPGSSRQGAAGNPGRRRCGVVLAGAPSGPHIEDVLREAGAPVVIRVDNERLVPLAFARKDADMAVCRVGPGGAGLAALVEGIRQIKPGAPCILLTDFADQEALEAAARTPLSTLLSLPAGKAALSNAYAQWDALIGRMKTLEDRERLWRLQFDGLDFPAGLARIEDGLIVAVNTTGRSYGLVEGAPCAEPFIPARAFDEAVCPVRKGSAAFVNASLSGIDAFGKQWNARLITAGRGLALFYAQDALSANRERDPLDDNAAERTRELRAKNDELTFVVKVRQRIEEALKLSERRLRMVVDGMPVMIMAHDADGRIIYWNRECERITGYPAARMVGADNVLELLFPEKDSRFAFLGYQSSGEDYHDLEMPMRGADGRRLIISLTNISGSCPIPGWEAWETGLDVTARKLMERELQKAKEEAEQANRSKSRFLADMSHEIRSPLNGILGFTDMIQSANLDEDSQENLELIRVSAHSLLNIINDILDFSKIEAGKLTLFSEEFDLRLTVDSAIKLFKLQARETGIDLAVDIAGDIPERLRGDPLRLRQLLINIVGNAVKYTRKGGVSLGVRLQDAADAEARRLFPGRVRLLFTVRDTGMGIPRTMLPSIFDSFTRVEGDLTKTIQGTGLGLAISKRLTRLMGGDIWAESEEGKGSVFHFTAVFGRCEKKSGEEDREVEDFRKRLRPLRALVVEDKEINRKLLQKLLQRMEIEADCAVDGREALRMLTAARYDCVLMDIQMPEMDGIEAARRIRAGLGGATPPDVAIIAVTGYAMKGDKERFLAAGMDEYAPKPIIKEELFQALARAVRKRGK